MVQTVFAPDGDLSADQIWKDVYPEKIMDSKLKCVFELPDEQKEAQEEPVKTSPKATVQQTATINIEAELQKAAAEVGGSISGQDYDFFYPIILCRWVRNDEIPSCLYLPEVVLF